MPQGSMEPLQLEIGTVLLDGVVDLPARATAMVLFAHGSGSSRHSPRNRYVGRQLVAAGFGVLLMDLLTLEEDAEEARAGGRLDLDRLAGRLIGATDWLGLWPATRPLPVGYFGASTGAAAALIAATLRPARVAAIVSRGGRPDLAAPSLVHVGAPTLLIVGSDDPLVEPNRQAYERLRCEKELRIVDGASHLFEEPGALEQVARSATEWFARHLTARDPSSSPGGRGSG